MRRLRAAIGIATLCAFVASCSEQPPRFEEPFVEPIEDLLGGLGFVTLGSSDVFDEATQTHPARAYLVEVPLSCSRSGRSCFVPMLREIFVIDDLDSFGAGFEFRAERDRSVCQVTMTDIGSTNDPLVQFALEDIDTEGLWGMAFDCDRPSDA